MDKKYYSEAAMVVHQSARDLFEIGAISESRMREFDVMCLVNESETANDAEDTVETKLTVEQVFVETPGSGER